MWKNNPYLFMFRRMWQHAPSKKMLFLMLLCSALSKVVRLIEPWILGQIVNFLQIDGAAAWPQIQIFLLLFALVTLVGRLFHGVSRVREEKIKFQVAESFASDMFRKVTSLPMQRQSDHHSGETIDKINKAMYAIREFSGSNFMYLNTIIFSIGSVFSLTVLRWKAGVIMLAFAVITFIVVRKFDQLIIPLIKAKNRKEHVVMSTLFDFLSNIKTVITLRFESRALTALRGKIADVFPVFRKYSILNEWKRFSMDMLMKLVITLVLGWYVWEQFQLTGTVLIGTFTMLFQYAQKMNDAFGSFTWQYSGIVTKKADMEAVADIEDAYAALTSDYQVTLANRQHIQLRDLLFTYADTDEQEQTLQGIHIDLAPGKKIALVGESGSGKSTLLSLLRGLYDVDAVSFDIDGVSYDNLHALAHSTSLIPQEPEIFEQTIRYNLAMGLDIADEQLWKVLDIAAMKETILQLPGGLDTDIKEKGVNLSGGQKQRLALARGLLMAEESDILLLDEPTSSVDSVNEVRIHEALFAAYPEKCIISSIHKLHLLELFDDIYVLNDGQVVERGTLSELQQKQGLLTTMLDEYQV